MKALITGITGFVGQHLANHLIANGYKVWGARRTSLYPPPDANDGVEFITINMENVEEITEAVNLIKPDFIYHLAGQSSVKESWNNKSITFQSNIMLTLNLLEAVLNSEIKGKVKILTVGSSEEYGDDDNFNIMTENMLLRPRSPYGVSKAAVSQLAQLYHNAYGLQILHVRPFNHIGPGQRKGFVVSDFAGQIVDIERGRQGSTIYVGNLSAQRDFTDVRDIVRAYFLLLAENKSGLWGDCINVCTGKATSIEVLLKILLSLAHTQVNVEVDFKKFRAIDVPVFVGDNSKLISLTGWEPLYSIEETLKDVLDNLRTQD